MSIGGISLPASKREMMGGSRQQPERASKHVCMIDSACAARHSFVQPQDPMGFSANPIVSLKRHGIRIVFILPENGGPP